MNSERKTFDRFFTEAALTEQERVVLSGSEVHHLKNVLRYKPGQTVELFNGRGQVALATVCEVGRTAVTLEVQHSRSVERETGPAVTVASAIPKGERLRWLVEKLTELGAARFVPLICERSVVVPSGSKQAKLQQYAVEACKQCRRNWLPEIQQPVPFREFLEAEGSKQRLLVAHPGGQTVGSVLADRLRTSASPVAIVVGPEGGFTSEELAAAKAVGAEQVDLGPRVLRVETAALALLAWLTLQLNWGTS